MTIESILILVGLVLVSVLFGFGVRFLKNKYKIDIENIHEDIDFSFYVIKVIKGLIQSYYDNYDPLNKLDKERVNNYTNVILEILEYLQCMPDDMKFEEKVKEGMDIVKTIEKMNDISLTKNEIDIIEYTIGIIVRLYPEFIS